MKIDLLCSDPNHPVVPWLEAWKNSRASGDEVALLHEVGRLAGGDVLFLISCTEILTPERRGLYRHVIVLHASDLPKGRGWSPHVWALLEGARAITVSAISAAERVDSGDVWAKRSFDVAPHALHDEIHAALFDKEVKLMHDVVGMIRRGEGPVPQPDVEPTYYPRRSPADSELDPGKSIAEQFDRMRVCDPERYPAFFKMHGHVYEVRLKKVT
jgi:methionyl-tRNA formyltransferase